MTCLAAVPERQAAAARRERRVVRLVARLRVAAGVSSVARRVAVAVAVAVGGGEPLAFERARVAAREAEVVTDRLAHALEVAERERRVHLGARGGHARRWLLVSCEQ